MTRAEAGRMGGRKTAERGAAFMAAIGAKGGASNVERHDPWHFAVIGAQGGMATKTRRGRAWFKQLGGKGG